MKLKHKIVFMAPKSFIIILWKDGKVIIINDFFLSPRINVYYELEFSSTERKKKKRSQRENIFIQKMKKKQVK